MACNGRFNVNLRYSRRSRAGPFQQAFKMCCPPSRGVADNRKALSSCRGVHVARASVSGFYCPCSTGHPGSVALDRQSVRSGLRRKSLPIIPISSRWSDYEAMSRYRNTVLPRAPSPGKTALGCSGVAWDASLMSLDRRVALTGPGRWLGSTVALVFAGSGQC